MAKGFYTDTTVCIGCKACQVACHQWNELPAADGGRTELSGDSYDNTQRLSAVNWRHVKFIEQITEDRASDGFLQGSRWLMMSERLQALRACRLPRGLPHRGDHSHGIRHGVYPAGRLQRLPRLYQRLSIRRRRYRRRRQGPQVHAVLRSACNRVGNRHALKRARRSRSGSAK